MYDFLNINHSLVLICLIVIENMILAVANNFVSDSYSAEVITVGYE